MFDLFGDTIVRPQISQFTQKSLTNLAYGFSEWWQAWPTGPRKVAKQQSLDKWARLNCAMSARHILLHTEWMKSQADWLKENGAFICAPLVYLNQQRWVDWMPEPERPKKPDVLAELKAHKGTKVPEHLKGKIEQLRRRA